MDNSKYIEFVNTHTDEIASYVDKRFEETKDFIRVKIIKEIRAYLTPVPPHYELKYDGNPYDHSGVLVKNGYISLDQSVMSFLENEYSGNKEATYTSGMGWNYYTYEKELQFSTIDIASSIMFPAIRTYIESSFDINLSDEDFQEIQDACRDFDDIYDHCIASSFFFGTPAVEFVNIENIPLKALIKKGF